MSDSNHSVEDRELDDYLAGNSAISRSYAAFTPEKTPPELDNVIIDASRKQNRSKPDATPPMPGRAPRRRRWMQPLAAIAALVLGVALLVDLYTDQTIVNPNDSSGYDNQEIAVPKRPAQGAGAEISRTQPGTEQSAASPDDEEKPEALAPDTDTDQTQSAQQNQSSNNDHSSASESAHRTEPEPEPEPISRPTVAPEPTPRPSPATQEPIPERQLPQPGPGSSGSSAANTTLPPSPLDERAYRNSPSDWMSRIVFLHDTEQSAPAAAELKEFRARYPDYPLPAELQSLDTP